jgi:hypothetical protein
MIVQLRIKLLLTVRETCKLLFEHKASAFAFDPTYKQKEIEGDYIRPMPGLLTEK